MEDQDRVIKVSKRGRPRTLYSPHSNGTGVAITWRGDAWIVDAWYDSMVGIQGCTVTQEDLDWLKGKKRDRA